MDKIVINSTEGGARIKGATQMLLKDTIEKYCSEPIDKSKLKKLMTLADNGDDLITKVIPLLENDIKNLENIIKNSRMGMAVNKGMSNLLERNNHKLLNLKQEKLFNKVSKQSFDESGGSAVIANDLFYDKLLKELKSKNPLLVPMVKLSKLNYMFSVAAHISSTQNPLVNVAIHGAVRQIQGRKLKVDETLVSFLKNKEIAETRMERNNLILGVAKKASESLLKSYKSTLEILKKYNKTKDEDVLVSNIDEEINLDDAETYFNEGNWAHPLLDSTRFIKKYKHIPYIKDYKRAEEIYNKAIIMREEAIKKAKEYEKENSERESKILKHNSLIEESQKAGKEGKFSTALTMIKEACSLIQNNNTSQWGLASVLNQLKRYDESINEYRKLIDLQPGDKPSNPRYRFELGQVLLLNNDTAEGFKEISKAMETTNEFDSFLSHMGDIYFDKKDYINAEKAYSSYLEKSPYDYKVWTKKGESLRSLDKKEEADVCFDKAYLIQCGNKK